MLLATLMSVPHRRVIPCCLPEPGYPLHILCIFFFERYAFEDMFQFLLEGDFGPASHLGGISSCESVVADV